SEERRSNPHLAALELQIQADFFRVMIKFCVQNLLFYDKHGCARHGARCSGFERLLTLTNQVVDSFRNARGHALIKLRSVLAASANPHASAIADRISPRGDYFPPLGVAPVDA